MVSRYFLNVFETVPVAPIITGITFVFTFHMRCIIIIIIISSSSIILFCCEWLVDAVTYVQIQQTLIIYISSSLSFFLLCFPLPFDVTL